MPNLPMRKMKLRQVLGLATVPSLRCCQERLALRFLSVCLILLTLHQLLSGNFPIVYAWDWITYHLSITYLSVYLLSLYQSPIYLSILIIYHLSTCHHHPSSVNHLSLSTMSSIICLSIIIIYYLSLSSIIYFFYQSSIYQSSSIFLFIYHLSMNRLSSVYHLTLIYVSSIYQSSIINLLSIISIYLSICLLQLY